MIRIKINKHKYQIPTKLKEVNLQQLVAFNKHNQQRLKLIKRMETAVSEKEQMLLLIQQQDIFDRMLVSISNIPYKVLVKLAIDKKSAIYQDFDKIMELIVFKPQPTLAIDKFKFGDKFQKKTFYLFEFGAITAKQMLWFEAYWKEFYQKIAQEVVNLNFEKLAYLIAICSFPKDEIDMIINDEKEIPFEIKPSYYNDFAKLVEQRANQFQALTLNIVYGCLNFFFINLKSIQMNIKTSM